MTEPADLICMREAEMFNRHPKTDYTHICALCLERVGIFPSGQAVLAAHPRGMIRIVCNRCRQPSQYEGTIYANPDLDRP
jgi:hypothetical protein